MQFLYNNVYGSKNTDDISQKKRTIRFDLLINLFYIFSSERELVRLGWVVEL